MNPEHFIRRLEWLDKSISDGMASVYRFGFALPAVGVALVAVAEGGQRPRNTAAIEAGYLGLVVLSGLAVLYGIRQINVVFVLAGQRKAIETFTEEHLLLPRGLFSWERGPAHEISGYRRLDGRLNVGRYLEPSVAIIVDLLVGAFALVRLIDYGTPLPWLLVALLWLAAVTALAVSAFRSILATLERVEEWVAAELERNVASGNASDDDPDPRSTTGST